MVKPSLAVPRIYPLIEYDQAEVLVTAEADIEAVVVRALNGLGIPCQLIEIDPAFADTADFCREYGYTLDVSGNTIVVASKREPKQYAACVLLGSDRLDVNRTVKTLMGVSKCSFASAEETVAMTGMMVGGSRPSRCPRVSQCTPTRSCSRWIT